MIHVITIWYSKVNTVWLFGVFFFRQKFNLGLVPCFSALLFCGFQNPCFHWLTLSQAHTFTGVVFETISSNLKLYDFVNDLKKKIKLNEKGYCTCFSLPYFWYLWIQVSRALVGRNLKTFWSTISFLVYQENLYAVWIHWDVKKKKKKERKKKWLEFWIQFEFVISLW